MASRGRPPRHHCPQFSVATHGDGTEDAARVTCHGAVTRHVSRSCDECWVSSRQPPVSSGPRVRCEECCRSVAVSPLVTAAPRLAPGHQQQHKQKRPKQTGRSVYKLHFAGLLPSFPGLSGVRCLSAGKRVPGPGRQ